jgi:hypothetical protein
MANQVQNAGGLDGVTGWSATSGAAKSIDEAVLGGPGRAVIKAAKALTAGQGLALWSEGFAVTAGQVIEAAGAIGNSEGGLPGLALEIVDGGGAVLSSTPLPVSAPDSAGGPRRGLAATFAQAYGRVTAPASGTARLRATSTATIGATHQLALLRPFLDRPGSARRSAWDPGPHLNPDLQLPTWPASLPGLRRNLQVAPYANRVAFAGEAGIPSTDKLYGGSLQVAVTAQLGLDPEQADVLDQFFLASTGPFFFLRPDTDQLCYAQWLAEGAPRPAGYSGVNPLVEVGLHLWIA